MTGERGAAWMRRTARLLLDSRAVGDDALRGSAAIADALPVREPGGAVHSWLVPVTAGERLAAFFQFLPDGTFMRFSSFQRRPGELAGCPEAADWLDPERIRSRAMAQQPPDAIAGEPFLTYDRSPDRLVWAVPSTHAPGDVRVVYVAGDVVYSPPPEGTIG